MPTKMIFLFLFLFELVKQKPKNKKTFFLDRLKKKIR